jgi:alpha-methylacyl-CoA racemase
LAEGTDSCLAPVLSMAEAALHPHNTARSTFVEIDGVVQPAPAPRFARMTTSVPQPALWPGEEGEAALADWHMPSDRVEALRRDGVIATL